MEANSLNYLELSKDPIRFDAASQLTHVFFDESNKQIFSVRSGGITGVVVKGPTEETVITFCMDDDGSIMSIKFSPDNQILAVQRQENTVEFICFNTDLTQSQHRSQPYQVKSKADIISYTTKNSTIHGFVWVSTKEFAIVSSSSVELFTINGEKRQIKSLKSLNIGILWFSWCPEGNMALLSTTDNNSLVPVLLSPKVITKLPKLDLNSKKDIPKRDVTLAQIHGTLAILILQQTTSRLVEVVIFLLNGAGLAPRKTHILRLGLSGRFAMNILDNLIVVHHQTSSTSMLFDVLLSKEVVNDITYHSPVIPGRTIKPFSLKLPSLSPDGKSLNCELYSKHWVLFQPNIVVDAQLGCMWYLNLKLEPLATLIADKVRLTEFLLQRKDGKPVLMDMLKSLVNEQYTGATLAILQNIFNRINSVYSQWDQYEMQSQTALPTNIKALMKVAIPQPKTKLVVNQSDMCQSVFTPILGRAYTENILLIYLDSLGEYEIVARYELCQIIIKELVRKDNITMLKQLVELSLISGSKTMACHLLSQSKGEDSINQIALDMLKKVGANEIIIEVLLGQGNVMDALRLAKTVSNIDTLSARKYLEAAHKEGDSNVYFSVFKFFQQRNIRLRGKPDFTINEQCNEFEDIFNNLFPVTAS